MVWFRRDLRLDDNPAWARATAAHDQVTLAERPDLPDAAIKSRYDDIVWRHDPAGFERWCDGQTGFPIV